MGASRVSTSNTRKITDKFSISIDLCKENKVAIHLFGAYRQMYNDDKTYTRLLRACKEVVSRYYTKNITTLEQTCIKRKGGQGHIIFFDTVVRLPRPMTTVEKRAYAYDIDGPVFQMAHELTKVIEKVIQMPVQKKDWHCGDIIFGDDNK